MLQPAYRSMQWLIRLMLVPARVMQFSSFGILEFGTFLIFLVITLWVCGDTLVWSKASLASSMLCWMLLLIPLETFSVVSSTGRITK